MDKRPSFIVDLIHSRIHECLREGFKHPTRLYVGDFVRREMNRAMIDQFSVKTVTHGTAGIATEKVLGLAIYVVREDPFHCEVG